MLLCLVVPVFPKLFSTGILSWKNHRAWGVLVLVALLLLHSAGPKKRKQS